MAIQPHAVIYTRCSPDAQTDENQLAGLREHAERMAFEIRAEICDQGTNGGKGRSAGYKRLSDMIARKEVDIVLCWSVDALSQSLSDLVMFLHRLQVKKVDLFLHQQPAFDMSNPSARALLDALAGLEKSLVREKILAGLERARKSGVRLGRPSVASTPRVISEVRAMREAGIPIGKISRKLRIGVASTMKILTV